MTIIKNVFHSWIMKIFFVLRDEKADGPKMSGEALDVDPENPK